MSNLSNSSVNPEDPDTIAMNPTDTGQQHLSVKQFYVIGIRAVIFGILVIFLLNLATPLEFVIDRFRQLGERGDISWISVIASRLFILCSMAVLSCAPFLLILHKFLLPVSACIKQERNQKPIAPELNETARKRLLNLPFFMVPVFILLWTCIPLFVFFAAVVSDRMDFGTALVFSLRSAMVGVISAAMTETRDPKQMVQILNAYFQEMDTAIKARSGLILQFLGDEIYAVFGAPVPCSNHAEQAFLTALEMTQGLVRLNKRFASQGWPVLSHGIGIHTGKAVAASIGSPDRLSYLLVGDTINLASRLQSLTRSLNAKIIISADTIASLPPHLIQKNL